jgi:molybdopterin biosynthesis enzyme
LPIDRPEWRGAERVRIQTGAPIPRPLQAAC